MGDIKERVIETIEKVDRTKRDRWSGIIKTIEEIDKAKSNKKNRWSGIMNIREVGDTEKLEE